MNRQNQTSHAIVVTLFVSMLCGLGATTALARIVGEGILPASVAAAAVEETPFTIKGVNFQEDSTVTVDGDTAQEVVFGDSSTLYVRLPGGIGPGQSTVCVWPPLSEPSDGEEAPTGPSMTVFLQVLSDDVECAELQVGCDSAAGCVSCCCGFYPIGASVPVLAAPLAYYHMAGWEGDTAGCTNNGYELVVIMDRNRYVAPVFEPNLAPLGTPEFWLASYGLNQDTFAAEELKDVDGDGMAAWAEYRAGTDPNDANSSLSIGSLASAGQDRIAVSFSTVAGKYYALVTASSLAQATWTPAPYSMLPDGAEPTSVSCPEVVGIVGTGGIVTVYVDASANSPIFFKIWLLS